MFGEFFDRSGFGAELPGFFRERPEFERPPIDLFERENEIVVKVDLPGIRKDDLEVNLHDRLLVIRGEKRREEEIRKSRYQYAERSFGSFKRSVEIPMEVQSDKVEVNLKDGLLEIRLPKAEGAAGKRIEIKVE
jgi:HSP20 family protein